MKPNFKDYLKATGVFVLIVLATIALIALVIFAITLISRYIAVAFAVGAILLVGITFSIVVFESIQELAKTYMAERLDKDDEM